MMRYKAEATHFSLFMVILVLSGLASIQLGKSAGFDLLLYHYYNAFALLHHRENFDVLAAGYRTFWNPLSDVLFYGCINGLPSRACGFAAGFVHGLNYVLVVPLAAMILAAPGQRTTLSSPLPWLLAAAGALGADSLGMLGGGNNDNVVSLFFLVSLFWVCRESELAITRPRSSAAWVLAAGISIGVGCGLKLTLVPFGVAIVCAPLLYPVRWPHRLQLVVVCGIGVATGVLVSAGFLMVQMYRDFGNPLFPFFNTYFDSPYRDFLDAHDLRMLPASLSQAIIYPLIFAFDPQRNSEFPFRDFRVPTVFVLAILCIVAWAMRRCGILRRRAAIAEPPAFSPRARVFLAVLLVAYVIWMAMTSFYRYLFPIELLSFVAMALLLRKLLARRGQTIALAVLAVAIIPTTSPWATRRLHWDDTAFIAVTLPAFPFVQANAIVLMAGAGAISYAIPYFPPDVRFLGVDVMERYGFATGENGGLTTPATESDLGPFGPYLRNLVASHSGQVLGMFNDQSRTRAINTFAHYGFAYDPAHCGLVTSNVQERDPLHLCELTRR
jgi:hypothetical protein